MSIIHRCIAGLSTTSLKHWMDRLRAVQRVANRKLFRRRLLCEALEGRQLMAADFLHNDFDAEDVNDDGQCSPLDAMLVVSQLNSARQSTSSTAATRVLSDVNNDGQLSPVDALMVISRLGRSNTNNGNTRDSKPATPIVTEVRTYDGTGNNLTNMEWGSTDEHLLRIAPAAYSDGISSPAGANRENPRTISNLLATQDPETSPSERDLSAYVYVWGQFIDHDISLTQPPTSNRESLNIDIPAGDEFFDPDGSGDAQLAFNRSRYDTTTGTSASNPRQQVNQITAWIDGSMVYGSSQATANGLRTFSGGKLITSEGNLLPSDASSGMFTAGDVRANENIELTAVHTLFVREHNYWAGKIAADQPSLTDEQVFQRARSIVIAEIQAITYNEWLPALLGRSGIGQYTGYKASVNPAVANEFSTAAFRLGHSLLQNDIEFTNNDGTPARDGVDLDEAFFNPSLVSQEGIDELLKYAASSVAAEVDTEVVDGVRNFLIDGPGGVALDLAALNIQRGRDHGLADYNATRVAYGLKPVDSFDDITSNVALQAKLQTVYGDVNNIDLWVGALAEDHLPGSSVGPLVQTIVTDQFRRLRDGDRFWYENVFRGRELESLRNTRLSDVIQRNSTVSNLQSNVFFMRVAVSGSVTMLPAVDTTRRSQANQTPVADVTIELLNSDGEAIDSTTTDVHGRYLFNSFDETGAYSVRVVAKVGTQVTSASEIDFTISRGDLRLRNLDFKLATL